MANLYDIIREWKLSAHDVKVERYVVPDVMQLRDLLEKVDGRLDRIERFIWDMIDYLEENEEKND